MSILTNKMMTASKRNISPACKIWFPCNEGSGSTMTDIVGGVVLTDAGAAYATPHAITSIVSTATSGTLSIPAGKHVYMLYGSLVVTAGLNKCLIGTAAGARLSIAGTGSHSVEDDDGNEATDTATAFTDAQEAFVGLYLNGLTGDLTTYESINGAGMSANTTVAASVTGSLTMDLTAGFKLNQATDSDTYGIAVWAFDSAQADVVTAFEWMRVAWTAGRKEHYPAWATQA